MAKKTNTPELIIIGGREVGKIAMANILSSTLAKHKGQIITIESTDNVKSLTEKLRQSLNTNLAIKCECGKESKCPICFDCFSKGLNHERKEQ